MAGRDLTASLVLVAHRSSQVLPAAVASFRTEARGLGRECEVVVVEQSEDPEEAERARAAAPEHLLVRANRGYAAGLNAGIAAASGDVLLLGNPDIRFAPGSLAALLTALDAGWDVVGPQFDLAGWLFPPADEQTPAEELRRFAASRSRAVWERFLRREVRRWRRAWESPGPVEVRALSGALLAMRTAAAARIGPWDEGYFLYFEEMDWLRRARRAGLRAAFVPAARVEHVWGHAASAGGATSQGKTAAHFGRSRRRFFARHFGWAGRAVSRLRLDHSPLSLPPLSELPTSDTAREALWLLSPSPLGFPAAGRRSEAAPLAAVREFAAACPHCTTLSLMAYDGLSGRRLGAWDVSPS